ncbi:polysaccharide ABC transporter ATP-binding protein [bacterium]|nr:polysaccharide ABC transporter ATP-binding protein [bacterium]
MSDCAILVENISKLYRIGLKEKLHDTFGSAVLSWIKSPISNFKTLRSLSHFHDRDSDDVLWALRNVSFDVKHGEVVGIIGRNGAGKSTLLRIISRITRPTSGRAILEGRVASLLEVGTGFHLELTGRENVYLNATILGMAKKEVDRKFDEIVQFSGIEKFIDTPFKHYSSGMKVRLGFSVAAHLEAEILLVDEVLAVGDLAFQKKCIGTMQRISSEGRTVLFVSHDMAAVERLCQKCILLEQGQVSHTGPTADVISSYVGLDNKATLEWIRSEPPPDHSYIERVTMIDYDGVPLTRVSSSDNVGVEIQCIVPKYDAGQKLRIAVADSHDSPIFVTAPIDHQVPYPADPGLYRYRVFFPKAIFMPRRYVISVSLWSSRVWSDVVSRALIVDIEAGASITNVEGKARRGLVQLLCQWECSSDKFVEMN